MIDNDKHPHNKKRSSGEKKTKKNENLDIDSMFFSSHNFLNKFQGSRIGREISCIVRETKWANDQ